MSCPTTLSPQFLPKSAIIPPSLAPQRQLSTTLFPSIFTEPHTTPHHMLHHVLYTLICAYILDTTIVCLYIYILLFFAEVSIVYCFLQSNFPKMSLFCFLLKEVRSSTTLELPDSLSSFVVKVTTHPLSLSLSLFPLSSVRIQWNPSNPDTNGAEESVLFSEVSSIQRLKCMQEWYLGWERCPV